MEIKNNKGRGYAGREKIPLYLYNDKYEYIKKYESKTEFCKEYFPTDDSIRPLFEVHGQYSRGSFGYQLLKDGYFICNFRAGKEYLRKSEIIVKSIYCKYLDETPIECFNLVGDKIAEFLNLHIATNITNIPKQTIWHQLNKTVLQTTKSGLVFKYKNNE